MIDMPFHWHFSFAPHTQTFLEQLFELSGDGMYIDAALIKHLARASRRKCNNGTIGGVGYFAEFFEGEEFIHVMPLGAEEELNSFFSANAMSGRDDVLIYITGNEERILISSIFDNLGKGASGAAIQCMNIRLGLEQSTGLKLGN